MSEARASLLIVEDDRAYRERLTKAFSDRGYRVRAALDVQDGIHAAQLSPPDYAIIDLRLPGGSGLLVLDAIKRVRPDSNVVVLTGYGSISTAVDAVHRGATNVVPKPADIEDLLVSFARGQHPSERSVMEHEAPSLARAEWEHIQRVLLDCDGNISQAARVLRIERRSLQRKLAKRPLQK